MAKLTLIDIESGYASNTAHNTNYAAIETALENTLSRDGTSPNSMSADLDLNNNDILNVNIIYAQDIDLNGASIIDSADTATAAAAAAAASASTAATDAATATTAAATLSGWEYIGTWTTGTAYVINNIVYETTNGSSYICLEDHTSGTFNTDLSALKWALFAQKGAAGAGTGDMLKTENLSGLANYTTARSNLGLAIGSDVQAYDADLTTLGGLDKTDGNFIVGNGSAWTAESGATARASLGLTIGTDVQAYDVDTLKADTADVLTAGFASTVYNAGTQSSGTFTLDEANGNLQKCVNGGAFTLAPPSNSTTIILQITNNASAGTITTSGWTKVDGTFTTTNGDDFMVYGIKVGAFSHLVIAGLQ